MANVAVMNMNGEQVGNIDLNDAIFGIEANEHVMHLAVVQYLANINCGKALIVMDGTNTNVMLSARNIPDVKTASVSTINVYDLLKYNTLVVTKDAVAKIEEVYA